MLIQFSEVHWMIGVVALMVLLFVLWRRKRTLPYLIFLSLFGVYLLFVVQAVVFPIYVNINSGDVAFTPSINFIPFYFGECSIPDICIRDIVENVVLTIPLGFGVNFLIRVRPRHSLWLGVVTGLGFELLQLATSLVFRSGFRAVDINDAILNATGVLLGYLAFRAFTWIYVKTVEHFHFEDKWLFADIYDIALQN